MKDTDYQAETLRDRALRYVETEVVSGPEWKALVSELLGKLETVDGAANPKDMLRCPFCGAEPATHLGYDVEPQMRMWVGCAACGASGPHGEGMYSAVLKWNTRTL